ncbi:Hypothetical predicted protein [Paramuricea clavata]|uniref:Uncharacterized protein n=1 Tax=Paramuricea clavata TaxID=317549 RepID=A0A6S7HR16_PARCT|nr:Hypothetical predicted protein [Paramuricea clavata]
MGPRLKLKRAIEKTYDHGKQSAECKVNFSTVTSGTSTTSTGNIALKGQMKLQVGTEGWSLKKLSEKEHFMELILMCNSDKERDSLKYAFRKVCGASAKTMWKMYGVENYNRKARQLEDVVEHIQQIRQGIKHLASIKEQAVLMSLGLQLFEDSDSDKSEGSEQDTDDMFSDNSEENIKTNVQATPVPMQSNIVQDLLVKSNFNWYAMSEIVQEEIAGVDNTNVKDVLSNLSKEIESIGLNEKELYLVT